MPKFKGRYARKRLPKVGEFLAGHRVSCILRDGTRTQGSGMTAVR